MGRLVGGILVLVLGLSVAAGQEDQDRPATTTGEFKLLRPARCAIVSGSA